MTRTTLTHHQAIEFYDKFGSKQDEQGWYENVALEALIENSDFSSAQAVCEFGCGTGKLAADILSSPANTIRRYLALDSSPVMIDLSAERLAKFPVAEVVLSSGAVAIPDPDKTFDRIVSCYVIDLLSEDDARKFIAESQRVLKKGGLLCTASLTHGIGPASKLVSGVWSRVHKLKPSLVGGCRPISLVPYLANGDWDIRLQTVVTAWGVPSEIIIAERR